MVRFLENRTQTEMTTKLVLTLYHFTKVPAEVWTGTEGAEYRWHGNEQSISAFSENNVMFLFKGSAGLGIFGG